MSKRRMLNYGNERSKLYSLAASRLVTAELSAIFIDEL